MMEMQGTIDYLYNLSSDLHRDYLCRAPRTAKHACLNRIEALFIALFMSERRGRIVSCD